MSNSKVRPNILLVLADNLGFGELGCYGGGILRGTSTPRLDELATEGIKLFNFAPEAQSSPSRAALMTGRYAIRTGNHSVGLPGMEVGLIGWERSLAEVLEPLGYESYIVGKWHIGETPGRLPTDHGFESWYGIPRSYGECLWHEDPNYDPRRDPVTRMIEANKHGKMHEGEVLTVDVKRNLDTEYLRRAKGWMKASKDAGRPFFMHFNHTLMHIPVIPRDEFKGKTGYGDMADSLCQLDSDVGQLLDHVRELGVEDDTIVVFLGDNGAEDYHEWRGSSGFFNGSYFTGSEGALRTPCMVRYPARVPGGRVSDDIVHITDLFTTLARWAGADVPQDRIIDGKDQRAFFEGALESSARDGFPFWMGATLFGAKWRHYKLKLYDQTYASDPALKLPTPHLINLKTDPKERTTGDPRSSWVLEHMFRMLREFQNGLKIEPLIPIGAAVDFVPTHRAVVPFERTPATEGPRKRPS